MKKTKTSLKDLQRAALNIERVLNTFLYKDLEEMLIKANYRLIVLEDALKSRASDSMTKGELKSWWEKYIAQTEKSDFNYKDYAEQLLSGYLEYDENGVLEYLDGMMIKIYNLAEGQFTEDNPRLVKILESKVWRSKKPSKRDLERSQKALNRKVDYISSFFCEELAVTLISVEVLENIIEGYILGEISVGTLKVWVRKWDSSKKREFKDHKELLSYLELGDMNSARRRLADLAFLELATNTKLLFTELMNSKVA